MRPWRVRDEISVILHKDNSISVKDKGRGIPAGIHETGRPTTEVSLPYYMQVVNLGKVAIKQVADYTVSVHL